MQRVDRRDPVAELELRDLTRLEGLNIRQLGRGMRRDVSREIWGR